MLQLNNETPFEAERAVLLDKDGQHVWVVILKATFTLALDGSLTLAEEQEPVCESPMYRGDPGASSLVRDCEVVVDHPGTDIILNGSAHAPSQQEVRELEVSLQVGSLRKCLRALGNRHWERGLFGLRSTRPQPFTALPIVYELAYGGRAPDGSPEHFDPRNPVGKGFALQAPEDGHPLPNVEDPRHLITSWRDRPLPAGFGAIASWWSPRHEHAGTFDQAWQDQRMPLWPTDYNPRYHCSAQPELTSNEPLWMGERVQLRNLTPSSLLEFNLPKVYPVIDAEIGRARQRQKTQLDRVIIEPDDHKLILVWRSWLGCGRDARRVRSSIIRTKEVLS